MIERYAKAARILLDASLADGGEAAGARGLDDLVGRDPEIPGNERRVDAERSVHDLDGTHGNTPGIPTTFKDALLVTM